MADRSRPAALEKVGVQNGVSLHDAEKVDGVATGVAIPNATATAGSARLPTVTANRAPGSDGYPVSGFCQATEWSDAGNLLNGPCPSSSHGAYPTRGEKQRNETRSRSRSSLYIASHLPLSSSSHLPLSSSDLHGALSNTEASSWAATFSVSSPSHLRLISVSSPSRISVAPPSHLRLTSVFYLRLISVSSPPHLRLASPSHLLRGSTSLHGLELGGRKLRVVAPQHAALRFLERGRRGAAVLVPVGRAVESAAAAAAAQLGSSKRQAIRARGTLQLLPPLGRISRVGWVRRVGPAPRPFAGGRGGVGGERRRGGSGCASGCAGGSGLLRALGRASPARRCAEEALPHARLEPATPRLLLARGRGGRGTSGAGGRRGL